MEHPLAGSLLQSDKAFSLFESGATLSLVTRRFVLGLLDGQALFSYR